MHKVHISERITQENLNEGRATLSAAEMWPWMLQ